MPTETELAGQVKALGRVLDKRTDLHKRLVPYDEGGCPIPEVIVRGRLCKAFRTLMPSAEAPWGSLVVDSKLDRLEPASVRDGDQAAADAVWGVWQDNQMDAEAKLGHRSALLDGRAFALAWPDETGQPQISLDDATQMVVQYEPGSRRRRVAALRRWVEGGRKYATLYRRDGLYKFQTKEGSEDAGELKWERRAVEGEEWPLANRYDTVPVVEIAVNRKLKPGSFGYARGEFEHCTGLIDRINLLTFVGLVVAIWMGFPLRGVIGQKILLDDDGNPIAPFESRPDSIVAVENPDAKIFQLEAADRKNLSVYGELDQLAVITKTPRHYFPLEQGMSNLSAEAIMASEGGMHAGVTGHKASLGEGWEELLRVAGRMLPEPVDLSPRAELVWKDHQSRSLAERADAFVKLVSAQGFPWQAAAELALNVTADQLARFETFETSSGFGQLLQAVQEPVQTNGGLVGVPGG